MKKMFTLTNRNFLLILIFMLANSTVNCSDLDQIKANLPKMLGASNMGKEFWVTIPPPFHSEGGNSDSISIFITSFANITVNLEVPGKDYQLSGQVKASEVIEFKVPLKYACPWVFTGSGTSYTDSVWKEAGIHIYSEGLLQVYVLVSVGNTSESFAAIPVSSLGSQYLVAGYNSTMINGVYQPGVTGCVGVYNNTVVKFIVGGNTLTKTKSGLKSGDTITRAFNAGDVCMIACDGDGSDLTGSRWYSSKPIAIVTGNSLAKITTDNNGSSYIAEMDLPLFTWGKDYLVAKIPDRKYPPIIRVIAKEKNTKIYRNGTPMVTLSTNDGQQNKGWIEMRLLPLSQSPASALISGNKPIAVTLYNPGVQEDGAPTPKGSPFACVQAPVEQFQKEIVFTTPCLATDVKYLDNYLNLVYETNSNSLPPDDLEIARAESGAYNWEKVSEAYPGTDEVFLSEVAGKKYAVKNLKLPGAGSYKIRANNPFTAYAYGYNGAYSYAHPASVGLKDLEKNDTQPPVPTWMMFCDGHTGNGTVTDKPDDSEVRSNLGLIYFHSDSSYNYKFDYENFLPGIDFITTWKLTVIDPVKDARAVITFTDRSGNDTTISIDYLAYTATIDPKILDFGIVKKGKEEYREFTISNTNNKGNIVISKMHFYHNNPNFSFDNLTLPFTLKPMEERTIKVKLSAANIGNFIDSIEIGDTCTYSQFVIVKAKVAAPIIAVTDFNFWKVKVGRTETKDCIIKNEGGIDLLITGIEGPHYSVYTHDMTAVTKDSPLIIAPGGSYVVKVTFKPIMVQEYLDSIVFLSNSDPSGDSVLIIEGFGVEHGLLANDYDWGRARIDRPAHPAGPYDTKWVPGQPQAVLLKNESVEAITITSLTVTSVKGDKAAFLINENDFVCTIPPSSYKLVEVLFQPKTVGEHEIKLKYTNSIGTNVSSILRGIGTVPKVKMHDIDFGTSIIGQLSSEQSRTVTIYNEDYEWADSLTITDLISVPAGAISTDITNYGSEGFLYNKNDVFHNTGKVILNRGDSVEFTARFTAQHPGTHQATLITVSDGLEEAESIWTGEGINGNAVDDGTFETLSVTVIPNPIVNDGAVVRIRTNRECNAKVIIYNSLGMEVRCAFSGNLPSGEAFVPFELLTLPAGTYYLVVNTGDRLERVKFNFIR